MLDCPDAFPTAALVSTLVTVAGWIIVYRLNTNAQKQNLRNQALDRARAEIVRGIRESQGVLRKYIAAISTLQLDIKMLWKYEVDILTPALERTRGTVDDFELPRLTWVMQLEEYEILFPETRGVRSDLMRRQALLFDRASSAVRSRKLEEDIRSNRARADALMLELAEIHGELLDQSALMEDLRIHVQNAALSEVSGRRIPLRQPPDPTVPRIVAGGKNDVLEISVPHPPASPKAISPKSVDDEL